MMRRDNAMGDFPEACPACGGRLLGRIGTGQFFCWDCCAQFSRTGPRTKVWAIDDEGSLVPQTAASTAEPLNARGAGESRIERITLETRR